MKTEMVKTDAELLVRVVSQDPLGPSDWPRVRKTLALDELAELVAGFEPEPGDYEVNDEPEEGFEQWYIFQALKE